MVIKKGYVSTVLFLQDYIMFRLLHHTRIQERNDRPARSENQEATRSAGENPRSGFSVDSNSSESIESLRTSSDEEAQNKRIHQRGKQKTATKIATRNRSDEHRSRDDPSISEPNAPGLTLAERPRNEETSTLAKKASKIKKHNIIAAKNQEVIFLKVPPPSERNQPSLDQSSSSRRPLQFIRKKVNMRRTRSMDHSEVSRRLLLLAGTQLTTRT